MGLAILQLFAVKEQIRMGEVPERCSVSLAIRIIRETVNHWQERPVHGEALRVRMRWAVTDNYRRTSSKKARYRADFKDRPAAKTPRLVDATVRQKLLLQKHLATAA